MKSRYQIVQVRRLFWRKGFEAKIIKDKNIIFCVRAKNFVPRFIGSGLMKFIKKIVGPHEMDFLVPLTRQQPQPLGKMRLPRAHRTHDDNVIIFLEKRPRHQASNGLDHVRGIAFEVEILKAFSLFKPRLTHAPEQPVDASR